jgi:transposase
MGKAHSGDLRERVYGEIAGGGSRRAAARRFGVSASTGVRLARRMAETGSLEPARQGRPPGGGKLAAHRDVLIGWVEAEGDITMPELAARLAEERQVIVHPASLSRFLRATGYTVKKNAAGERSRTRGRGPGTPNVANRPPATDAP